jgi:hypothetical protein
MSAVGAGAVAVEELVDEEQPARPAKPIASANFFAGVM